MLGYNFYSHCICRLNSFLMYLFQNQSQPVWTDKNQFLPVPVQFFWVQKISRTGPILVLQKKPKNQTGPDLSIRKPQNYLAGLFGNKPAKSL